jgi:hypothetical protein
MLYRGFKEKRKSFIGSPLVFTSAGYRHIIVAVSPILRKLLIKTKYSLGYDNKIDIGAL